MNEQTEDWVYVGNPNKSYQFIPKKFLESQQESDE